MKLLNQYIRVIVFTAVSSAMVASCNKLVSIGEPRNTLTTEKIFSTDAHAESALLGLYGNMISNSSTNPDNAYQVSWSAGLSTFAGGLSGGEISRIGTLKMTLGEINLQYALDYWRSAYNIIFLANSVIEGIAASTSEKLSDSARRQITAEALFLRALSFFYLVNYFGDVPMTTTIDFHLTSQLSRTPKEQVYQLMVKDLETAYNDLGDKYTAGSGKRVRANKWAAAALLARVHCYLGEYEKAAGYATEVIDQQQLFTLETISRVFLTDSKEAIFQLMQTDASGTLKNATSEGMFFLPRTSTAGTSVRAYLEENLLQAFEPDDQRYAKWTDSITQPFDGASAKFWYPSKYKTGSNNAELGAPQTEYYMVLRLAELYLIRAEARANGASGGIGEAIADLNKLRFRAGLPDLPLSLTPDEVKEAVWHERQVELFAEWGHRWLDLKRSGKANQVLSVLPANQPWDGDWQFLYPIPQSEIEVNRNLTPNPGYEIFK
jgi:hypothetical protein